MASFSLVRPPRPDQLVLISVPSNALHGNRGKQRRVPAELSMLYTFKSKTLSRDCRRAASQHQCGDLDLCAQQGGKGRARATHMYLYAVWCVGKSGITSPIAMGRNLRPPPQRLWASLRTARHPRPRAGTARAELARGKSHSAAAAWVPRPRTRYRPGSWKREAGGEGTAWRCARPSP